MKIALTIGHSILKSGSITSADGTAMGGVNEYKYNKKLAPYIAKYLEQAGHTVDTIICPEKKFAKSTEESTYKLNIVNKGKYDLVVELHLNASDNKTANGAEVLYISTKGKEYAQRVQTKLATIFKNRGVVKRDNLYMLTKTTPVTIMLETFFCTSEADYSKAKSAAQMDKLGKLIAEGIHGKTIKTDDKEETSKKEESKKEESKTETKKQGYIKILANSLNVRSKASWSDSAVSGTVTKNQVFTVAKKVKVDSSYMYKLKSGLYISASEKYVEYYEK